MSFLLDDLDAEQLVVLASVLSINFSKGLTASQTNILGNLLNSIGDLLSVIAAKQESIDNAQSK
jgi:hypothetical protein